MPWISARRDQRRYSRPAETNIERYTELYAEHKIIPLGAVAERNMSSRRSTYTLFSLRRSRRLRDLRLAVKDDAGGEPELANMVWRLTILREPHICFAGPRQDSKAAPVSTKFALQIASAFMVGKSRYVAHPMGMDKTTPTPPTITSFSSHFISGKFHPSVHLLPSLPRAALPVWATLANGSYTSATG